MRIMKFHPDTIRESGILTSKKFWAYLLGQAANYSLSLIWLLSMKGTMDSLNLVFGLGLLFTGAFLQVGFLLGQSYLDRFLMLVREVVPGGDSANTPLDNPEKLADKAPEKE
jgi:hypothetical protein